MVRRMLLVRRRCWEQVVADYEVITSTRIADLQDRVKERVRGGWQPVGGIALLHEEDSGDTKPHMVFAQAVVLENGAPSSGQR